MSTVEVEAAIFAHPDVSEAAVVARPDPKWGETVMTYVELTAAGRAKWGADEAGFSADLVGFCRGRLAGFKLPRVVRLVGGAGEGPPLPKTSTGKIQKHVLRELAKQETDGK